MAKRENDYIKRNAIRRKYRGVNITVKYTRKSFHGYRNNITRLNRTSALFRIQTRNLPTYHTICRCLKEISFILNISISTRIPICTWIKYFKIATNQCSIRYWQRIFFGQELAIFDPDRKCCARKIHIFLLRNESTKIIVRLLAILKCGIWH